MNDEKREERDGEGGKGGYYRYRWTSGERGKVPHQLQLLKPLQNNCVPLSGVTPLERVNLTQSTRRSAAH